MTRSELEERARQVLLDHGLLDLPVDPVKIANALGIKVYNAKFGDANVSGLLALRGGTSSIYLSAEDQPVRKRFTVAHELGHFVLHLSGRQGDFVDTSDSFRTTYDPDLSWTAERRMEWEANIFAAALLMEETLVRKKWDEIRNIEGTARWFQVSQQAMAIRLESLGIHV